MVFTSMAALHVLWMRWPGGREGRKDAPFLRIIHPKGCLLIHFHDGDVGRMLERMIGFIHKSGMVDDLTTRYHMSIESFDKHPKRERGRTHGCVRRGEAMSFYTRCTHIPAIDQARVP